MNSSPISKTVLWLLLSILSAGSMVFYVAEIWSANQPAHFSDLYAPWWGAHELLLRGRNPYSPAVAHEIQAVIYGAPASATSADDPSNIAGGFAYPPYAALLLWPTVYLTFSAAQKLFVGVSVVVTLFSLALWLRTLQFQLATTRWLTIALFTLGSFPALQGLKLGNLSLLAAALVALALLLLSADHLFLGGIFLALSTFKPQFTIALLLWLTVWTVSDWRRRRGLAWSFLATLLLLVLISEWLLPGWIGSFLHVLRAYRQYTYGHSLLDVWFTPRCGVLVAACLLFAVLGFCWRYRFQPVDSMSFIFVISLLLAVDLAIIPTLAPHAQLLLLPGILCLLRGRTLLSSSGALARLVSAGTWSVLAWPWIAAFGLMLAASRVPLSTLLRYWQIPLYTSPLLPLAVSLAVGCLLGSDLHRGNGDPSLPITTSNSGSKPANVDFNAQNTP